MPEETTPPAGTPSTPEAGQIDWDSPDNPYLKRFQDTQSAYTQNQQRLKELELYESDPQAYFKLGEKHNVKFEFEDQAAQQDQQQGAVDPELAALRQQMAEQQAWREQVEAERQAERAAAGEELFHQDLDKWATEADVKLSKRDHNAIFGLLMKAPDPTQESTARQIFEAHVADMKAEREAIEAKVRASMKWPRVPHTPGGGGAANTATPDFSQMSKADIDKYMTERVMASD